MRSKAMEKLLRLLLVLLGIGVPCTVNAHNLVLDASGRTDWSAGLKSVSP